MSKPKLLQVHVTPETNDWLIEIARRGGHRSRAAAARALLEGLMRDDLEMKQAAQRVQGPAQSTPWGEF